MLIRLRDMDVQLLRLFLTIVESGGFSAAQGTLGMAPSTISTQMTKLETRLGFRLCDRGKSGFRLTPKGNASVDLRCYLTLYGEALTETWSYLWSPQI